MKKHLLFLPTLLVALTSCSFGFLPGQGQHMMKEVDGVIVPIGNNKDTIFLAMVENLAKLFYGESKVPSSASFTYDRGSDQYSYETFWNEESGGREEQALVRRHSSRMTNGEFRYSKEHFEAFCYSREAEGNSSDDENYPSYWSDLAESKRAITEDGWFFDNDDPVMDYSLQENWRDIAAKHAYASSFVGDLRTDYPLERSEDKTADMTRVLNHYWDGEANCTLLHYIDLLSGASSGRTRLVRSTYQSGYFSIRVDYNEGDVWASHEFSYEPGVVFTSTSTASRDTGIEIENSWYESLSMFMEIN